MLAYIPHCYGKYLDVRSGVCEGDPHINNKGLFRESTIFFVYIVYLSVYSESLHRQSCELPKENERQISDNVRTGRKHLCQSAQSILFQQGNNETCHSFSDLVRVKLND